MQLVSVPDRAMKASEPEMGVCTSEGGDCEECRGHGACDAGGDLEVISRVLVITFLSIFVTLIKLT